MGDSADILDELTIEMDELSFELRMLMSRYVSEVLSGIEERQLVLDLSFPLIDDDSCSSERGTAIALDPETGLIVIALGEGGKVTWDELSVSGQDIIIRQIHHEMIVRRLSRDSSGGVH